MKKIYSKFTKERGGDFRIETAIYQDDTGKRIVRKSPLSEKSSDHVKRMYENYQYFKESGLMLPCDLQGESVVFPFITGTSFYDLLLEAIDKKDKKTFLGIIDQYVELVNKLYPQTTAFEKTSQFETVFGLAEPAVGMDAVKKLNIDLTFDNIIVEKEKTQIFDYEWIFDFPVPLKYAVYRAVYALCVKNRNQFLDFVDEEEIYQRARLSEDECKVFFSMNEAFMWFVVGGADSYTKTLQLYEKPALELNITKEKQNFFAQIFWDTGSGYTEEQCENFVITAEQKSIFLEKDLSEIQGIDEIRIDPLNVSVLIEELQVTVEVAGEGLRRIRLEEMRTNRKWFVGSNLLFESEDPQILIRVPEGEIWNKIRVEYRICRKQMERLRSYKEVLDSVYAEQQKKLQEKISEQNDLLKESIRKLEQQERLLNLYKDKLEYIESSKIYKSLLKNKIDKQKIWEELG